MVHERRLEQTGEVVELRVSGQVRLGNLIMYDTKTESTWLQETGRSLAGEREGQCLTELKPGEWEKRVRWDQWKQKHPDSKVLYCEHCNQ